MLESEKWIKREPIRKIEFTPHTKEERMHMQRLHELLHMKRNGDWKLVGEIIGTSAQVAEKSFSRVYSKRHMEAVNVLEQVIENRIKLLGH